LLEEVKRKEINEKEKKTEITLDDFEKGDLM
jgi:hypothetical protein